jgi:HEAT repeat protein
VRHEAAFLLADLKRRDLIFGSMALAALWSSVHDQSVLVRHEVALSLAAFPGEVTTRCLDQLLRDQCEDVRLSAKLALEEITEREAKH